MGKCRGDVVAVRLQTGVNSHVVKRVFGQFRQRDSKWEVLYWDQVVSIHKYKIHNFI